MAHLFENDKTNEGQVLTTMAIQEDSRKQIVQKIKYVSSDFSTSSNPEPYKDSIMEKKVNTIETGMYRLTQEYISIER